MDNFNITGKTKFWIYVTTSKLWKELEDYIEKNTEMFISTFKYPYVTKGDIVLIYSKNKIDKSKTGFVCITQIISDQIDNSSGKIKIFSDKNLNLFCYQIKPVIFLPQIIKIDDILPYINNIDTFKNKTSFIVNYLKYDSIFKQLDHKLGNTISESFFDINPESISFEDNKNEPDEIISDDESQLDSSDKNTIDQKKNHNDKGNIPLMVILCPKALDKLVCEPDNESNIIYDHLLNCKVCDVTDNGNIQAKLINIWKDSDISYLETDSDQDEYKLALDSYYNLKNHNPFDDDEKPTIRLLNIIEQGNIYNDCMIIESYFPISDKE